jgi:hypothetical protein
MAFGAWAAGDVKRASSPAGIQWIAFFQNALMGRWTELGEPPAAPEEALLLQHELSVWKRHLWVGPLTPEASELTAFPGFYSWEDLKYAPRVNLLLAGDDIEEEEYEDEPDVVMEED